MNSLPPPLGSGALVFWRIDPVEFAPSWNRGEGSFRNGGRWNPIGIRTVYAALDPATTILEVAVHKGFANLDTVPRMLTRATVVDPTQVRIVTPDEIPNPDWLTPAAPSAGQQAFGAVLLASSIFVLLPSVVSRNSWNLIFDPARAAGGYGQIEQHAFALDPRLHLAA